MKKNPGEWLKERARRLLLDVTLLKASGVAWLGGSAGPLYWLWAAPDGLLWDALLSLIVLLPGAVFFGLAYKRPDWQLRDMWKGADAEVTIGQAIEYALTRDGCAVAHHVEEIAQVGDIDHLVVTPRGLWVIETKHKRVPTEAFPETLRRIAHNVEGVRAWAPRVRVTGCLVFASKQTPRPRETYRHKEEEIRCFDDRRALMKVLRKEARGKAGSFDLAGKVWKLGKLEPQS